MDIEILVWLTAIPFLIHLIFVNINLGTSITSFLFRYYYGDLALAKKLAMIALAGEFVSGTLGTILTVILAGIWTPLMNIAGNILYIPLLIALLGIAFRLPSIGGYWYTLERGGSLNILFGILMIVGGFMIPYGFRYIFAFIDYPVGLESLNPLKGDIYGVLANPLFPPRYILSIILILIVGFSITLLYVYRGHSNIQRHLIKYIFIFVILYTTSNIWLTIEYSRYASYLYNIFILSGHITFYTYILSWISIFIFTIILYRDHKFNDLSFPIAYIVLPISTLITIEFTYNYSRFPYFVITGDSGIDAIYFINRSFVASFQEILAIYLLIMSVAIVAIVGIYLLIVKNFFTG
ncbi:MAG TPA: hypothetical protein EYH44_02675 [Thermoprotei archaeon]|nr:hypothetical protein [Thermoprotei archaeon]